jgi:integrase
MRATTSSVLFPTTDSLEDPVAITTRKKRGPSLSRRTGQAGCVYQNCKTWSAAVPCYGRFWIDVPDVGRKQKTIALGRCATRSIARQRLREYIESSGVNGKLLFQQNTAPGTTLRQQAERWIQQIAVRRRRTPKPATVFNWRHSLDRWILPTLGDKLLLEVSNNALRGLIELMSAKGLSAQTIVTHAKVVKMIVASAVNDEGEQLYPRTWNNDYIGLPIIETDKQHRPTVTSTEVEEILAGVKDRYRLLFALLAGTGLRIGEALALKPTDFGPDCRLLHVRRSLWHGQEQAPKTANAVRTVDIPEELASVFREKMPRDGYVFATSTGKPFQPRNLIGVLHRVKKVGMHAFRRYRLTWLRKNGVPKDLERFWIGHAPEDVGDLYSKLKDDAAFRGVWCEKAGLGFSVVSVVSQNTTNVDSAMVA